MDSETDTSVFPAQRESSSDSSEAAQTMNQVARPSWLRVLSDPWLYFVSPHRAAQVMTTASPWAVAMTLVFALFVLAFTCVALVLLGVTIQINWASFAS